MAKSKIFETFEEMVEYARAMGATHIALSNYHAGAFLVYEQPESTKREPEDFVMQFTRACLKDILFKEKFYGFEKNPKVRAYFSDGELINDMGEDLFTRKRITKVAAFNDTPPFHYSGWSITDFDDGFGLELNSQCLPIETAIDYYRNWNKYYQPEVR